MNISPPPDIARPRAVRRLLTALLLLAALALAVAGEASVCALTASAAPAPAAGRYSLHGEKVAIYNLAGRLEVVPGTGSDVVVEVTLGGHDADRLRVETGPLRDESTLRVIYPGDRVVYPALAFGTRTSVRVQSDGTFGERHSVGGVISSWLHGGRRVWIRGSGSGLEANADLRVSVPRGQHLDVHVAAGEAKLTNVDGEIFVDASCSAVTADGVHGRLGVDVGSGDVSVRRIEGDLTVDTGSGGVRVEGVRGRRISLDTGSGGVEGDDLECENLLVDTGSGHVSLRRVNVPEIKVDTGSGGVDIGLLADVRSMLVDTGSGGVTLAVPSSLGAEIEVDTGSGGIQSDVPVQLIRRDGSYLLGKIGDGDGKIRIDTGSGGVRLRAI